MKKVPKAEIERRVKDAARILDLEPFLKRKPRALSGGQRQRVAMGRAIVRQPQAFLMDEPLSNLDAKLRVQMRAEIEQHAGDLGVTTIYVTHDQVEAMTMGDRVAVMRKGELQQVAPPAGALRPAGQPVRRRVHRQPGDEHARGGARAHERQARRRASATSASRSARRPSSTPGARGTTSGKPRRPRNPAGGSRGRGARPARRRSRLRGKVKLREALGSEIMVHFTVDAQQAVTEDVRELAEDVGDDRAEPRPAVGEDEDESSAASARVRASARGRRSTSPSTRGHCTSSTRRRAPGSTTNTNEKGAT